MIIGDQIRFRSIEKEDLPYFVKWLNDPEVRQGLSMIMPLSQAEEEDWFEGLLKNLLMKDHWPLRSSPILKWMSGSL